jgi:hypothetical protein
LIGKGDSIMPYCCLISVYTESCLLVLGLAWDPAGRCRISCMHVRFVSTSLPSTSLSHTRRCKACNYFVDDLTDYLNRQLWWLLCGVLHCCFGGSRVFERFQNHTFFSTCKVFCLFPSSWNNRAGYVHIPCWEKKTK